MNKENIVLIGILAIVVVGLVYSLSGFFTSPTSIKANTNVAPENSNSEFATKTSESTVTVDLTPKKFNNGKLYVDIGVNTHTVDLARYDLKEIVTLEFEDKSIKPTSAPKLSGHHNSGQLIFDVGRELDTFKITINGLPDIQERLFEWS